MMAAAVVDKASGWIVNIIVADPQRDPSLSKGQLLCSVPAGPFSWMHEWDGTKFIAPRLFAAVDASGKVIAILSARKSDASTPSRVGAASVVPIADASIPAIGVTFSAPVVAEELAPSAIVDLEV